MRTAPGQASPRSDVPDLQVRVGDAERGRVDARLQQAVGDGLLTLSEYDERAGAVWRARTRGELAAVTADLPPPAHVPSPDVVSARLPARRRRPVRRLLVGAAALAALAAVSGVDVQRDEAPEPGVEVGEVLAADAVGDVTHVVEQGQRRLDVGRTVGVTLVVVPDGTRVDLRGVRGVGAVDCALACRPAPTGPVLEVHGQHVGDLRLLTRAEAGDLGHSTGD